MSLNNKQILLKARPGKDFPRDLSIFQETFSALKVDPFPPEHVLFRNLFISVDPVMRVWLSGARTYYPSLELNTPMYAFGVAQVIKSSSSLYRTGDIVLTNTKMQEYLLVNIEENTSPITILDIPEGVSPHHYLNILGNNGLTAYYGLFHVCKIKEGETIIISTAAGATGLIACQLAKLKGCKVVALTGTEEKKKYLLEKIKVDYCINYRAVSKETPEESQDKTFLGLLRELKKACPKGAHAYFDNVGEYMLDAALAVLRDFGRVALCGALASYQDYKSRLGIKNYNVIISKRFMVKGFVYADAYAFYGEFKKEIEQLVKDKKLLIEEEILNGVEQAPKGLQKLFLGQNIGKILIKVAPNAPSPKL